MGLVFADEHALGNGQQAFAQVGQAHRALVSVKQEDAEAFFEFAYLVGDCRLGEEQALGGAGEAAVQGHGMEGFQLCVGNRHRAPRQPVIGGLRPNPAFLTEYDRSV
ncbi:hypothetical protein D9M73_204170 [compost metagenome]